MRLTIIAAAALVSMPAVCPAQESTIRLGSDVDEAITSITPEDILRRIAVMAHDSMRGRDTPSPELDEVADWVGQEFQGLGLAPGGDNGSFVQRYSVISRQLNTDASGITLPSGREWKLGRDVARFLGETTPEGVSGEIVVLMGRPDNASDVAAVEMSGRIVLWIVPRTPGGDPDFGLVNQTLPGIRAADAAAVVMVTDRTLPNWQQLLARSNRTETQTGGSGGNLTAPLLEVLDRTAGSFLNEHNIDTRASRERPFSARPLPVTATVTTVFRNLSEDTAPNTVGILEGSDPTLRNEYIVYSAHMDHVGICQPNAADQICNGADDDASGTAGIIEAAEAFAMLETKPRRSIIFLAVSGEEKGLWGSDYFAANPPVDTESIVANINADMIGRNWPDTIVVIGKEHSDLGATLNRVNTAHPELNMTAIDDIWPEENFYFRSDHFNFARRGIPVLFFFNGTHGDYHRPSDELENIDAEKESRIVKLMFYLGLEIANTTARPEWNPESYRQIVQGTR